jgi:hypothetical protein
MAAPPSGSDPLSGQGNFGTQKGHAAEGKNSPQANLESTPRLQAPAGSKTSRSHAVSDPHAGSAAADDFPGGHTSSGAQTTCAAGEQDPPAQPTGASIPIAVPPELAEHDAWLAFAADILDDLEHVRIANENRLRTLTSHDDDGFGLDETHPDVARLAALVAMLADAEHKAELTLGRHMRTHPLNPWIKGVKGIGEKQGARLLAAIGDPYWNTAADQPRRVSDLWSYCGYGDAATQVRKRGQKANWNATAKMRAFLVAESCMKIRDSPYRAIYDAARDRYKDAIHIKECVRCGPKNHPALPGTPLSDGHRHARALRAVAKEILRDLWRASRDLAAREG